MRIRYDLAPTPRVDPGQFKKGTIFRHGRLLSPVWHPELPIGEQPKAVCLVTSVRKGWIYFCLDHTSPFPKGHICQTAERLLEDGAEILEGGVDQ